MLALQQCSKTVLEDIIDQSFSRPCLSKIYNDGAGNYFVQHLVKIARPNQLDIFFKSLLDEFPEFPALLGKYVEFAGRYFERLSERKDFLNLFDNTSHLTTLIEKIGMQAAHWANHRTANYACQALLKTAPMWFVCLAIGSPLTGKD